MTVFGADSATGAAMVRDSMVLPSWGGFFEGKKRAIADFIMVQSMVAEITHVFFYRRELVFRGVIPRKLIL